MKNNTVNLGVTDEHVFAMNKKLDALERENDWIGDTRIRHAVSERLVEIRLLLRDGHTKNKNRIAAAEEGEKE